MLPARDGFAVHGTLPSLSQSLLRESRVSDPICAGHSIRLHPVFRCPIDGPLKADRYLPTVTGEQWTQREPELCTRHSGSRTPWSICSSTTADCGHHGVSSSLSRSSVQPFRTAWFRARAASAGLIPVTGPPAGDLYNMRTAAGCCLTDGLDRSFSEVWRY